MKLPDVVLEKFIPNTRGLMAYENGRPRFFLEENFVFWVDGVMLDVPAGFVYDNASVPRGLWNAFPPYDPLYAGAACIHDMCYAGELFPRKYSDQIFLATMVFTGVPKWRRNSMYFAVRVGGGFTYRKHSLESVATVRRLLGVPLTRSPLWESVKSIK
jgi:hypothetical protein